MGGPDRPEPAGGNRPAWGGGTGRSRQPAQRRQGDRRPPQLRVRAAWAGKGENGGAGCLQPLPAFANVRPPSTLGLRGQRPSDSLIPRRGAGAVERGGLENRCARERTVGSNPTLSAIYRRERFLSDWLRPDVYVVFEGYAAGPVNRASAQGDLEAFYPQRSSPDLLSARVTVQFVKPLICRHTLRLRRHEPREILNQAHGTDIKLRCCSGQTFTAIWACIPSLDEGCRRTVERVAISF